MSEPSFGVLLASGMFASLAVDLPLYPVDTLRTRLQAPNGLFANGGLRGIWNGYSTVVLMSMPASGAFFVAYDQTQLLLERRKPSLSPFVRDAAAASLAEVLVCAVSVPSEVVKQRMQTSTSSGSSLGSVGSSSQAPSVLRTMQRLAYHEGLAGFYRGLGAQLCREIPFAVMQMSLFEAFKRHHPMASRATNTSSCVVGMTCGGLSGAMAGALTTPLDLRRRAFNLGHQPLRSVTFCQRL